MRKKLIAAIAVFLLIVPMAVQAIEINTAENIMPSDMIFSANFQLQAGRLKTFLEPFLRRWARNQPDSDETTFLRLMTNKLLDGTRFFFGLNAGTSADSTSTSTNSPSVFLTFPMTDADWQTITSVTEREPGDLAIYRPTGGNIRFMRLGGFALVDLTGQGDQELARILALYNGSSTDSLSNNADYQQMVSSYLSPRFFGMTINMQNLSRAIAAELGSATTSETETAANLLRILKLEGLSFAEIPTGYKMNIKVTVDPQAASRNNFVLNPGGSFMPFLYTKFSNAKPIYYGESYNVKAEYAQLKRMLESLSGNGNVMREITNQIASEIGVNVEEIMNVLDKEMAFAVQYDQNAVFPYVTVLANVQNSRADATRLLGNVVVDPLVNKLTTDDITKNAVRIVREGGFTKIMLDVTKLSDEENPPPFPEFVFTFGISDDGLLIMSNYPGIDDASKRTGFASDADFSAYLSEAGANSLGIGYVNARNVFGWFDSFLDWTERTGGGEHSPPLDFYQGYYTLLEKIYPWKDLFIISRGDDVQQTAELTAAVDNARHRTYRQFLSEMQSSDRDGDNVTDYLERYVYHTPVDAADSDHDGTSDFDELLKGENPNGQGRLFADVPENTYYTQDVAFLKQRGTIGGYGDRSFKPSNLVNRAEFTAMVVRAFEQGTENFIGADVSLKSLMPESPMLFSDVSPDDWYFESVLKAYRAGLITGSLNSDGDLVFRPGDNINRAEAITILNRASKALAKTRLLMTLNDQTNGCGQSVFADVHENDWFCSSVANAYNNGVTRGKTQNEFKPFDYLTRAEAAVMIRRTLQKDLEEAASGTESVGEILPSANLTRLLPLH